MKTQSKSHRLNSLVILLTFLLFISCNKESEPNPEAYDYTVDIALSEEDQKVLEDASVDLDLYLDSLFDLNGMSFRQIYSDPNWRNKLDSLNHVSRGITAISVSEQIQYDLIEMLKYAGGLVYDNRDSTKIRQKESDSIPEQMAYAYVQVTYPLLRQIETRVFPNVGDKAGIYRKYKLLGLDCSGFLARLFKVNGFKNCDFSFRNNPTSVESFQYKMPNSVKNKYFGKAELISLNPLGSDFKYRRGDLVVWGDHGGIIDNPKENPIVFQSNGTPKPKSEVDHKNNYAYSGPKVKRGISAKDLDTIIFSKNWNKKGQPVVYRIVPIIDKSHKVSGDNQNGEENKKLGQPLKVSILDKDGFGIPEVIVEFTVISGGGSVSVIKTQTNSEGLAQTEWILGTEATGIQKVNVKIKKFDNQYFPAPEIEFNAQFGSLGCVSTITDEDGNTYNVVKIGSQCWMKENLKTTKYRNGAQIIAGNSAYPAWQETEVGAYVLYDDDLSNNNIYGKLYNFYAVIDSRGLCPTGWHVPTHDEWNILEDNLGGSAIAGGALKSLSALWNSPNTGANNESGFSALPSGALDDKGVHFWDKGKSIVLWSSTFNTQATEQNAWVRELVFDSASVQRWEAYPSLGSSVRCLKD